MWTSKIIVLKFGSSILRNDAAANDAVAEIYRHLRRGWRVRGMRGQRFLYHGDDTDLRSSDSYVRQLLGWTPEWI